MHMYACNDKRGKNRGKWREVVIGQRTSLAIKMIEWPNRNVLEDFAIVAGLIGVQFVYAGNSVVISYFTSLGLHYSSIIVLSSSATFAVVSPLSYYIERHHWPQKLGCKLLIQVVIISFGGVIFQALFVKGIELTSPALATAMPNLAPGLIFIIACLLRLESVNSKCIYSKVKIGGTLTCVIGAVTMSILQSTIHGHMANGAAASPSTPPVDSNISAEKIIGSVYLMLAVVVLSSNVILQAVTLVNFPAPMSLCAITSLLGTIFAVIMQLIKDHRIDTGYSVLSVPQLIIYSLLSGIFSGACVSFNGWAIKKRGPVLVSMFNPIGTVCSVILSAITLGQPITLGSLAGMCLMFTGLYFVLWAKGKETFCIGDDCDVEKPLLK